MCCGRRRREEEEEEINKGCRDLLLKKRGNKGRTVRKKGRSQNTPNFDLVLRFGPYMRCFRAFDVLLIVFGVIRNEVIRSLTIVRRHG